MNFLGGEKFEGSSSGSTPTIQHEGWTTTTLKNLGRSNAQSFGCQFRFLDKFLQHHYVSLVLLHRPMECPPSD